MGLSRRSRPHLRLSTWVTMTTLSLVGCGSPVSAPPAASPAPEPRTARSALASTTGFQDGVAPSSSYDGSSDTSISQANPTTNYAAQTTLLVDGDEPASSGNDVVMLVSWDISSLPTNATVQSASLVFNVTNSSTQSYGVFEAKRAWSSGQATWNQASSGVSWEAPGAAGSTDRGSTQLGTLAPTATGSYTVNLNSAGIGVVQNWVSSPSSNKGFLIVGGSNSDGVDISSGNATTTTQRPRLNITYSTQDSTGTVTLFAAGDIAQHKEGEPNVIHDYTIATGNLLGTLLGQQPNALVAALGDLVYPGGQETENKYLKYYEPTWGSASTNGARKKANTRPALGNHDYYRESNGTLYVESPTNYFNYWGAQAGARSGNVLQGWYSYNFGSWHIIVLNPMCKDNTTDHNGAPRCSHTEQLQWLQADLAANAGKPCTLAYWHNNVNSSGKRYSNYSNWGYADKNVIDFYKALYNANADVILTGHAHWYERMAPMKWDDTADSVRGIRQFVAGMGGQATSNFPSVHPLSEEHDAGTAGILELNLGNGTYSWKFHSALSWKDYTDSGTDNCH